jgi:uncharacterized protein (DUF1499 family)
MKSMISVLHASVILPCVLLTLMSCTSKPPKAQLVDGRLRACPGSPNCVSSESEVAASRIAPLAFQCPPEIAWERLKKAIRDMGGEIQEERDSYLWATFTTRVFRFVDDVEFRMVTTDGIIHVRSASRKGYSDLGVNRKRVEKLRARFNQKNVAADRLQAICHRHSPVSTRQAEDTDDGYGAVRETA